MIALEHVQPGDWDAVGRVVDTLQSLVLDTGRRSIGIRFGVGTASWGGANSFSGTSTFSHGLGRTPVAVFLQEVDVGFRYVFGLPNSTQLNVAGYTTAGNNPGVVTKTFYWLAIG